MKKVEKWEQQRAKEAEARRLEGNSRGGSKSSSNLNETSDHIRTAAEAAKKSRFRKFEKG